ncbi:Transposon Ty3-I Gag-Pol polyprotein like [Argiope bruennichi]|uniref:Transposon Ty3-I Gag-Pol polyprotein like n=1 Tax=Argiope bruennichi TaxID=94029 RepID=A0A8T0F721_ARGBR|nr:Transposon Ty3-I Gag-Pol polyprotein like [Argiope bruennichi]
MMARALRLVVSSLTRMVKVCRKTLEDLDKLSRASSCCIIDSRTLTSVWTKEELVSEAWTARKNKEIDLAVCLADDQQSTSVVLKTTVPITVHGRTFRTNLHFLPHAKGNRTLLGVDFLRKSGIMMDMQNNFWYFAYKPNCRIPFSKDIPLPTNNSPAEILNSSCQTDSITSDGLVHNNHVAPETNNPHLRQEGQNLDAELRNRLTALLNENEDIFRLGGQPTPYIKPFINTGGYPPVASTPYRLSPKQKELLNKEIDELLANDVIEECESPYAAPVVLVPKSNETIRLSVDYRKLNAITKSDK